MIGIRLSPFHISLLCRLSCPQGGAISLPWQVVLRRLQNPRALTHCWACRVTWLLERVNELSSGDVTHLSKATLDSAGAIAKDFAMIRPILDTLLLSPVMPAQRNEGFSRALSAPLTQTTEVRLAGLTCLPMPGQHPLILLCGHERGQGTDRTQDA